MGTAIQRNWPFENEHKQWELRHPQTERQKLEILPSNTHNSTSCKAIGFGEILRIYRPNCPEVSIIHFYLHSERYGELGSYYFEFRALNQALEAYEIVRPVFANPNLEIEIKLVSEGARKINRIPTYLGLGRNGNGMPPWFYKDGT